MTGFNFKDRYNTDDLLRIVEFLRTDNGCPWDKQQTHESIRANVLEEAYEVADAIDRSDDAALCEEAGDLLLQVVFHSVLAEERNAFCYDDVVDGIVKKLVFRHPHVFGDVCAENAEQALASWDAKKRVEKDQQTYTDTLRGVAKSFPALMRAVKVIKRANKADFFEGLPTDADALSQQIQAIADKPEHAFQTLGDLLLCLTALARQMDINPEEALERATDRLIDRFESAEKA